MGIVGAGAMGTTLGLLLKDAGYEIEGMSTRSRSSLENALDLLPLSSEKGHVGSVDWLVNCDIAFLTTPDDQLEQVAQNMTETLSNLPDLVIHTSGSQTSSTVLEPVREKGIATGSIHPLQTVPDPKTGHETLPGSPAAVCSPDGQTDILRSLADDLQLRPFKIKAEQKPLYHASAVTACNLLVGLLSAAFEQMEDVIPENENLSPEVILRPLVESTLSNIFAKGPREALTGPAERGDIETIRSHMNALDQLPDHHRRLYKALTEACLQLSKQQNPGDEDKMENIRDLLRE